jgi:hypothetical protein
MAGSGFAAQFAGIDPRGLANPFRDVWGLCGDSAAAEGDLRSWPASAPRDSRPTVSSTPRSLLHRAAAPQTQHKQERTR